MIKHVSFRRHFIRHLSLAQRAACLMLAISPVTALAASVTWDSSGTTAASPVDGPGNWASNASNWSDGASDTGWVTGNSAIIGTGGTAGTITINDPSTTVSVAGITFNAVSAGDYTIAAAVGNSLTLTDPNIIVNAGSPTISAPIAGSVGLTKTGAGNLTLGAANTYTGTTTLNGGSLIYTANNLTVGQLTFGLAAQSTNVSTLDLTNANLTATGLLVQTNTASVNNLIIGTGKTFTVNGAFTIGTPPTTASATTVNLTATGGGAIVVNNTVGNVTIGVGSGVNNNGAMNIAVDLTALSSFTSTATTGGFYVGFGTRPTATLRLSNTANTITSASLVVGSSTQTPGFTGLGGGNNNGGVSLLQLGAGTNLISTNAITIGATKAAGSIGFAATDTTGSVTINGEGGATTTTNITFGTASSATATNGASTLNLAGHNATVNAGTVIVGNMAGSSGGTGNGAITFDTGTFNVASLQLGVQSSGTSANGALGNFTLGGPAANSAATGILNVSTAFNMGNATAANANPTKSNFVINGGTANVNTDITTIKGAAYTGTFTSTITLAGGSLNMSNHNIGSAALPITNLNLTSGNLTNASNIFATTVTVGTPNITGTTALNLSSAGTLTAAAGLTLPSGFTLAGGATSAANISGAITAASGSLLAPGNASTAGTLAFANDLSLNSGSALTLKLSPTTASGNDLLTVGGNLTLAGTINLSIGTLGTGPVTGNTYTLATYTGALTGDQTNFNVIGNGSRTVFTIVPTATTAGSIQLAVSGSGALNLTYTGATNSNWNLISTPNFTDGSNAQQFFNADSVNFTDLSTNNADVQIVGTLNPGAVNVNAGRNYTFAGSGTIIGNSDLTKSGAGTLFLAAADNSTGNTAINLGTLQLNTGGSLPTGNITNNAALVFNTTASPTIAGIISGSGTITQNGAGTTAITNASNSYSGNTTINSGAIRFGAAGAAGSGTIIVNANGALFIGAALTNPVTLNGGTIAPAVAPGTLSGDVTVSANSTIASGDSITGNISRDVILTGLLHGSGNIATLAAPGLNNADGGSGLRIRSTGASDYTGTINVAQGFKLELQTSVAGPYSPINTGKIVATAGTTDLGTTVTGTYGEVLYRNNSTGNTIFGNDLIIAGTGTVIINPLGTAPTATNVTLGNLTIGNNQQIADYFNTTTLIHDLIFTSVTLTGGNASFAPSLAGFGPATALSADIILGNTTESASSGVIMNGTRTLHFNGSANAFTGNLAINSGTVQFDPNPTTLASNSSIGGVTGAGNLTVSATATLTSGSVNVPNLTVNGSQILRAGSSTSKVSTLTIAGSYGGSASAVSAWSGSLDLTNSKLVVEDSTTNRAADLAQIKNEALPSNTIGNVGIFSSTANAANIAAGKIVKVVAVSDNAVRLATFPGGSSSNFGGTNNVDSSSILIAAVFKGDANMDGVVDIQDLTDVANHWQQSVTDWSQGDFDGSNFVDIQDLTSVANNWQAGVGAGGGQSFSDALAQIGGFKPAIPTPEPASLALLTLGGLLLTNRRRRA